MTKHKPVKFAPVPPATVFGRCAVCKRTYPDRMQPTDTERLAALLRWGRAVELRVWVLQAWRYLYTRRDIDELLKEEKHG